jgi:hypothetical protein
MFTPNEQHTQRAPAIAAAPVAAAPARELTATADNAVQMIVLHGDKHAACLDGSPYAFYIKPGSTDSFTIGIHGGECSPFILLPTPSDRRFIWLACLLAGGWAYREEDALERSKNGLGTSTLWNLTDCFNPPAFSCYGLNNNCTQVFMPYCDGSSFTSYRKDPWPVPNSTALLHFRGKMNFERTIDILERDWGLGKAKDVVLAGGSAGGLSTYLHLDRLAERLPAAVVVGAPVAGYFLDHQVSE